MNSNPPSTRNSLDMLYHVFLIRCGLEALSEGIRVRIFELSVIDKTLSPSPSSMLSPSCCVQLRIAEKKMFHFEKSKMPITKKLTMEEKHPELFKPETDIDRRLCRRIVPMEVMNLGFPRTGTMCKSRNIFLRPASCFLKRLSIVANYQRFSPIKAIQVALDILGYNCYHSSAFFTNIRDTDMWNDAMDAKYFNRGSLFTRTEWDQLLGSYSAVSADPPAVAFAEDLVAAYPKAKVILVEREIESWYRSFDDNIISAQWSRFNRFVCLLDSKLLGPVGECHRRWATGWMKSHSKAEMRRKSRQAYREHYALVRKVTPKEQLLEYRLETGWGPLCEFLGKPIPDMPFPRVNDSAALQELLSIIIKRGVYNAFKRSLLYIVLLMILTLGIWLLWSSL